MAAGEERAPKGEFHVQMDTCPIFTFVHDRIYNSFADYKSSRVGVGWRMSPLFFHDGITFERFELEG